MHAVPPEGPLHRNDRDPEPARLEEPTESAVDHGQNRRRAAIPTLVLVVGLVVIVALVFLL
jgi:hypothetical protein